MWAQEYSFRYYGSDEGLTNLAVKTIFQDRTGFLWVSTENGLFRFDGQRFRRYGAEDGMPRSLACSIAETRDGILLVGSQTGIFRLDKERFVRIDIPGTRGVHPIGGLVVDASGNIWAGTESGLYRARPDAPQNGWQFQKVETPGEGYVTGLFADGETLWFRCGRGVCRLTGGALKTYGPGEGLKENAWGSVRVDKEGNTWARSRDALAVLRKGTSRFELVSGVPVTGYSALGMDHKGRLLLPTQEGLSVGEGGRFRLIGRSAGLLPPAYSVFEDREHSIWIGLAGRGLVRWRGYDAWESWGSRSGLGNEVVYNIVPLGQGDILAGTEGGLYRGRLRDGVWTWELVRSVPKVPVHAVVRRGREIWIGADTLGIARVDLAASKTHWVATPSSPGTTQLYSLAVADDGRLWAGTSQGLFVSDLAVSRFDHVASTKLATWSVVRTTRGMVAGSIDGLLIWTNGAPRKLGKSDGLAEDAVLSATEAPNGDIWVGYRFSGLVTRLAFSDPGAAPRVTHFGPGEGILSGITYSLRFDSKGVLWAGTDNGLLRYDGKEWTQFTTADGLVWDDCDLGALAFDDSGSVWVGTSAGMSRFRPDASPLLSAAPAVVLTSVQLGTSPQARNSGARVDPDENHLVARYSALSTAYERRVIYRYRLLPLFADWRETTLRELQFPRLPAGKFTLELQARVARNEWGAPVQFEFEVGELWWHSTWFLTASILLPVAIFLYLTARQRRVDEEMRHQLEVAVAERTMELEREKARAESERARAEQASRLKGEFLANMSHEIRTPMNGILGTCSVMLASKMEPQQREYVEIVVSSGRSMIGLINDILDFSRIEAGKADIVEAPFPVAAPVRDTCRTLAATAQEKGLNLTWNIHPDVPKVVRGDAGRIGHILMNLVGNAIKFTPEGDVRVDVRAAPEQDGEVLLFEVTDTGVGIGREYHSLIFEAFQQGDGSTSRRFGGTGLGLAISARLAALMGGRIDVESQVGCGSRFTCVLPLKRTDQSVEFPEPEAALSNEDTSESLLVLLAEDNRVNQLVAVSLLTRRGHRVVVAQNGLEVLERTVSARFDVILMDVQMPEMDGFEATRELRRRELENGGHVPVIAVTAHADREHHEMCLDSGMDFVLTKPFEPERLFAAVEVWPRRRPSGIIRSDVASA
ncbi:MAG: ATP-binding protein [Bryobacteraceae bacterium]|nr:ATP-binding protein [Bryobacteraceae bacterium]